MCGARIELRKEGRVYACPVCACTFSRNSAQWKVGIPVAGLVAVLLWMLVPLHKRLAACLGAIAVLMLTAKASFHTIVSRGRADLTRGEAQEHKEKWKESKWFIVAVALLLMAILGLLVFGLKAKH